MRASQMQEEDQDLTFVHIFAVRPKEERRGGRSFSAPSSLACDREEHKLAVISQIHAKVIAEH